jgi:sporulation protein YlmC with PRC-barrel domain
MGRRKSRGGSQRCLKLIKLRLASLLIWCNAAMQPKEKTFTRDKLVSLKVVDAEGYVVGTVKDVGFTVGKHGITLNVEDSQGNVKEVPWECVQAVGDVVLLKPNVAEAAAGAAAAAQAGAQTCPSCGGQLSFIPQYQRWYCYRCQKYA